MGSNQGRVRGKEGNGMEYAGKYPFGRTASGTKSLACAWRVFIGCDRFIYGRLGSGVLVDGHSGFWCRELGVSDWVGYCGRHSLDPLSCYLVDGCMPYFDISGVFISSRTQLGRYDILEVSQTNAETN
jgi:hypothetical protein